MVRRFVSIWFRYLNTDWFSLRQPDLKVLPFVLRTAIHGRMIITSLNANAEREGIVTGMVLADARAIVPNLQVMDDKPDLPSKLLNRLAEWCIRFSPVVAIDPPDGLIIEATGCTHLWGGDKMYLEDIIKKLQRRGYEVRAAIADTPGAAWAVARFGNDSMIIASGQHEKELLSLPPESLRLDQEIIERLHKLGLHQIRQFIKMPRQTLRRRFGEVLLSKLDKALGTQEETIKPVCPLQPYQERLPCLEPIVTAQGIEIALRQLLEALCNRLRREQNGLRVAVFKGYRVDGKVVQVDIGTNRPSYNVDHLFKLFELKVHQIEPALGIELFILEASKVEDHFPYQEKMWQDNGGLDDIRLSELVDRLAARVGTQSIHRYLAEDHHWPERSYKDAHTFQERASCAWRRDKMRPLQLIHPPERIEVTAPIPDYPPMLFRYKGKLHKIVRADGPERIEQEWWLRQGQHRDYYCVEDEDGHRYWLFRLGHYDDKIYNWFIHGFFA